MHTWKSSSIHAQSSPSRFRAIGVLWERDAHLADRSSGARSTVCHTSAGALYIASDASVRSSSLGNAAVGSMATHSGEVQRTRVCFRTARRDTGPKAVVIHVPDPDPARKLRVLPLWCGRMPWSAWACSSQSHLKDVHMFLSRRPSRGTNSTPSYTLLRSPSLGRQTSPTPLA